MNWEIIVVKVFGQAKGESFGIVVNGTLNIVNNANKIWDFYKDSNLTYARVDKKIGFVNNKGEWVINPKYDKARAFNNGLAPVFMNKEMGLYQ